MTEEDDRSNWLLEPPGANEIRLVVEVGANAELTPELQASLESLMSDLNEAEVQGFAGNMGLNVGFFGVRLNSTCSVLTCSEHKCSKLTCGSYSSLI